MNTSISLLPPSLLDLSGNSDFWVDPHGCFIGAAQDCPPCSGCGTSRTYFAPDGEPLTVSINIDDESDSDVTYEPGISYSDCTYVEHRVESGSGCVGTGGDCNTNCNEYGQSVVINVTRTFTSPIDSLAVSLRAAGDFDDIGFVGSIQLNNCCGYLVSFPLDVTPQVTVSGAVASFTCRSADVFCTQNIFAGDFNWVFTLKEE